MAVARIWLHWLVRHAFQSFAFCTVFSKNWETRGELSMLSMWAEGAAGANPDRMDIQDASDKREKGSVKPTSTSTTKLMGE